MHVHACPAFPLHCIDSFLQACTMFLWASISEGKQKKSLDRPCCNCLRASTDSHLLPSPFILIFCLLDLSITNKRMLKSQILIVGYIYFSFQFVSFFFFFWGGEILVSWPRIEPMPTAVETWSPNHWTTREVPGFVCFCLTYFDSVLSGIYTLRIVMSSWELTTLSLCNAPLYSW